MGYSLVSDPSYIMGVIPQSYQEKTMINFPSLMIVVIISMLITIHQPIEVVCLSLKELEEHNNVNNAII